MIKSTHDEFEILLAKGTARATEPIIQFLEDCGLAYNIKGDAITLEKTVDPFQLDQLTRQINAEPQSYSLEVHRTITSTNDYVMQKLSGPELHTHICLAEMQTRGKGRRGRQWVSPFGKNIYLSVGHFVRLPLASLGGLSLVTGMEVVNVLRSFGLKQVGLKWPNDVVMGDGKLAGILVELKPAEARGIGVVVGVGINLSFDTGETESIDQPFSEVASQTEVSRNQLAGRLLDGLLTALNRFSSDGFSAFASDWADYNVFAGKEVVIIRGDSLTYGVDRGVDEEGNLLLETEMGIESFNSGEVSVRTTDRL